MSWFKKPKTPLQAADRREMPGDVWEKCPSCGEILYREKLRENWNVCPKCGYHLRLPAEEYVNLLIDEGTANEQDAGLHPGDPLEFVDLKPYRERLVQAGQGGLRLAGTWAWEALRVEAWRPRLGREVDERAIPHELDWLRTGVHLDKGCYRGQETVARVFNLGRPPRRLVLLHLDGSEHPNRGTGCCTGSATSASSPRSCGTPSSGRSPSRWSSARCRRTPSSWWRTSPPPRRSSCRVQARPSAAPPNGPARGCAAGRAEPSRP